MATAHALMPDESRRAEGPKLLAMPPRPPAGRGPTTADEAGAGEFSAREVLNALRYHSVLFVFLGTLVAGIAGAAAWTFFPAKFATYAMLRVDSNEQAVIDHGRDGGSRTEFSTYLSTQAALIKSHLILNRALGQSVGGGQTLRQSPVFTGLDDPVAFLEDKLTIEFSDRSEIMKVGMMGDDPDQISNVVNAVVDSFMTEVKTYRRNKQLHYDKLFEAKTQREKALEELQKTYQDTYKKTGNNEAAVKTRQARMLKYIQLQTEQSRWQKDEQWHRAELAKAQAREAEERKQSPAEVVVPEVAAAVDADPAVYTKKMDVKRVQDYVEYRKITDADKDSPHIREYQRKAAKLQLEYEELKKQTHDRLVKAYIAQQKQMTAKAGGVDAALEVYKYQQLLDQDLFQEKAIKEELLQYADLAQEPVAAGPPGEQKVMEIQLDGLRQTVADLNMQADRQRAELTADDRVKLYEKAHIPQHKEMKKQIAFTGAGVLAGYFLVAGLITVGEVRRKRVYSHADPLFARVPLLGRIPEHGFIPPAAGSDPAADDRAGLAFREAIDRVKTLVLRQMTLKKAHSLLVVSPAADEGKSILAWNIAAGFARNDYKVLFIDANLVHPTIQDHLKIAGPGLSEVLRGEATLVAAVVNTPVNGLDCLPAGRPDTEARRCLDKPALARILDKASAQYDLVVIDTCALSEAVDPLCIAQRVDAAVVSLRTFRSRTPDAEQTWQRLQLLGTPVLGTVLTDPTLTGSEV